MKFNQVKTELGPKLRQSEFARAVDVVPRTVRNWNKKKNPEDFRKLGRPAHDERAHRRAFWRVAREYVHQDKNCGWRPIAGKIGGDAPDQVPIRLIQIALRTAKSIEKRRTRARIANNRVRVEVVAKEAIWVQDSTQVGRDPEGLKIESQVIKDRGTLATVGLSTGAPASAANVINLLEKLKQTRGLPLVLASDNGSPFVADEVERYLERERVIHLKSLPRTPQHNGAAEIGIRELKRCAGLDKAESIGPQAAHARIAWAAQRLNKNRIRTSKGLKTSIELDEQLNVSYHVVERDRFYQECSWRMREAQLGSSSKRERRMAEREAIYSTLEQFGLVRRYRGGSQATTKAEIFS